MIPRPADDIHLPFEQTARAVAVLAADYPLGARIPRHRHRRAQLLYAIEGVMIIEARVGRWVVPPTRAVWLDAGLEHTVRMSGNVKMRTVFVEPEAVAHLPRGACVVEVPALLRELILAAAQLPLDYDDSGRDGLLVRLLLAELAAIPRLPLYLPWPRDKRLRALCDAVVRDPGRPHEVAHWAARLGVSTRTLHRVFQREIGMTFGRWRQHARLLSALERLAHGEKILSIALDHGYASQSAFAAMFKQHFGVPPSAFYA
ncbi:AraC family transcriptional regulator [Bordetella pseudohinzii]|uniref:AraC family transcriptional regulator n=1 Tax=Bordetella pseudohinzii TaxID=1331258 RepID=A0A0J6CAV1_9BORD|nr:helix-turn-helix transcriptional regulator [Bordetella pseudohinzii]ANY17821.1 AraC family transcriptional regulator [Bordetella pseudohinzii]KMM26542.1 AraC family transcriptional regulator [Bordetella pseudohinzii]KXA77137.1 AraC family transcriptional regulator [Bordetella pseudohinzii]KXA77453.1 AraC family transcriptional regulator [Bordetella pseudohinzii]CUI77343.1 HTH-type transcriptional repressor of iron proteins A [Bordetella pseudohinzii]